MPEITLDRIGILNDRGNSHLGTTLQTHQLVDLVDLRKKPVSGSFASIDVDVLFAL